MPKDESRRINPKVLDTDRESHHALDNIADYAPANPSYTKAALTTLRTDLDTAQARETQAAAALATARDEAAALEWKYHNAIIGMRDQVMAQYGRDSSEVQTIGRTRESERKAPGKRNKEGQ